MHANSENPSSPPHKASLCKFFTDGRCNKGKNCAFAHGEAELVARVWPQFERKPRTFDPDANDAWAARVLQAAAPLLTCDLKLVYQRAPGLFDILHTAGGLKSFCNAHSGMLHLDTTKNLVRSAPKISLADAAALLRGSAQKHGGHVTLTELYAERADLQEAIQVHGGVTAVCERASEPLLRVAMAGEEVRIVSRVAPLPDMSPAARAEHVLAALRRAVRGLGTVAEGAEVYAFGSEVSGFGGLGSDVDVVLHVPDACLKRFSNVQGVLRAFQKSLARDGEFVVKDSVLKVKVPILKLQLGQSECDLSCNNLLPLFNTALLAAYAAIDARLVALVRTVKLWAKEHNVHGAVQGHLSSYGFTLLSVFYAQRAGALPCLQAGLEPQWYVESGRAFNVAMRAPGGPEIKVRGAGAELDLRGFARLFTREVAWGEDVVSVRTGALLTKGECTQLRYNGHCDGERLLHIEDPLDLGRNLNCVLQPGHGAKLRAALEETCG